MQYRVQLIYFRPTGKFVGVGAFATECTVLDQIWEEVHELRRMGQLPNLRPNSGRDLHILVDVMNHPTRELRIVVPPFTDDDDVTPVRVPTRELLPLVRIPLEELPRTTSPVDDTDRPDDEKTPVDRPFHGVDEV